MLPSLPGLGSTRFRFMGSTFEEEKEIEVHCKVCGKPIKDTKSGTHLCSGNCRLAYKNPSMRDEIREKSDWKLVKGKWLKKGGELL